jgi:hypothetical protein
MDDGVSLPRYALIGGGMQCTVPVPYVPYSVRTLDRSIFALEI